MSTPIPLEQEIEAETVGTDDFVFRRVGEAVPIKSPTAAGAYSLSSPPPLPLAVSDSTGSLFVAHSEGFLVALTKDVLTAAKEVKSKGSGSKASVEGVGLVDVRIGRVDVVALSWDSSTLVAIVGMELRFYEVALLLNKVQEPFFLCSLNGAGMIKDFKWRKCRDKSFVILSSGESSSNHGPMKLYHGSTNDQPKDRMNNVDAVDWSAEGEFVAVVRKNTVSILSSDLNEQHSMSLLFKSRPSDDGLECNIKVESINWVGANSIIVGCVRVDGDGNEDGHLVQVITTRKDGFLEKSCMPQVYSFPDLFGSIADDQLPFGSGPYLLSSYLDRWKIILTSNKKALDNHVVLLQLLVNDGAGEVVSLEFQHEMSPRIDLQENGDDNFVLGLGVDKVSLYDKVLLQVGSDTVERSPYCVLMCLTSEGKLIMFHALRISESLDLPSTTGQCHDDSSSMDGKMAINNSLRSDIRITSSSLKDDVQSVFPNYKLSEVTTKVQDEYTGPMVNAASAMTRSNEMKNAHGSPFTDQLPVGAGASLKSPESPYSTSVLSDTQGKTEFRKGETSPFSSKSNATSYHLPSAGNMNIKGFTKGPLVFPSNKAAPREGHSSSDARTVTADSAPSFPRSTGTSKGEELHFPSHDNASTYHLSGGGSLSTKGSAKEPPSLVSSSNKVVPSERHSTSDARMRTAGSGLPGCSIIGTQGGSFPTRSGFSSAQPVSSRTFKPSEVSNSEQEMSKPFYNVKDMVNELDALLSSIEQEGGFKDSCANIQRSSILALEEDLENIFEMSRKCKNHVEEKLVEIKQIQHKMLQISSRQVYMEGILKQASNDLYWDIWNRQKLSPEFELKRDNILNAYENLKSQLIELERHFDSLEIKRFGETGRVTGRRASQRCFEPSRQTQSLHSLYNTLSSQLAAAQQLSECLSNQMAVLNLNSPSVRRQNVAKELFESIGLTHGATALQCLDNKKVGASSECIKRVPLSVSPSKAMKEHSRVKPPSALTTSTPKTARRRDTLDKSLLSFEPQKTTVKRMLQGRLGDGAESPFNRLKEASSLQIESSLLSQQRTNEVPAFSLQSSLNKFQSDTFSPEIQTSTQALAPRSSSVFKWAAKESVGLSHSLESKSPAVPVVEKNTRESLSMMPLPSPYNTSQVNTKESSSLADVKITGVTQFGGQSNSSVKSFTFPKTIPDTQFGTSGSIQTSSPDPTGLGQRNEQLNMKTGGWGVTSSLQRSTKDQGQTSDQLNTEAEQAGLTRSLQRSTKDLAVSSASLPAIPDQSNISSLAPISAAPYSRLNQSSGSSDIRTDRNDVTGSLSGATKVSIPTTSFLFTTSASTTSSIMSTSVKPSSASTLFATTSVGTKSIGESCGAAYVSPSVPVASSPSTSFSSGGLSFESQTLPNSASSVARSTLQTLTPHAVETSPSTKLTQGHAPQNEVIVSQSGVDVKHEPSKPEVPVKDIPGEVVSKSQPSVLSTNVGGNFPTTSSSSHNTPSIMEPTTTSPTTGKDGVDMTPSEEDEMDEEAPDTTSTLNLGALGGFGLGSAPTTSALKSNLFGGSPKSNIFGDSFVTSTSSSMNSLPNNTGSPGQLFRPASFSIPSVQPIQQAQAQNSSLPAGGFSGFGQPAQLGAGQQALGSVLGSFGQSRQIGAGVPGFGFAPAGGFAPASGGVGGFAGAARGGGFAAAAAGGGFAGAATGGGFAGAAQGGGFAGAAQGGGFAGAAQGGGFAGAAQGGGFAGAGSGGGFAGAAQGGGFASSSVGGFGSVTSGGGGFSAAPAGGGFGGAAQGSNFGAGGFGAFGSNQGGGFSAFGGGSGTGRPPAELLTQMRK